MLCTFLSFCFLDCFSIFLLFNKNFHSTISQQMQKNNVCVILDDNGLIGPQTSNHYVLQNK